MESWREYFSRETRGARGGERHRDRGRADCRAVRRPHHLRTARLVSAARARHAGQERDNWELIGHGEGIHWPDLDEDISVEGLIAGRQSGEGVKSFRRWLKAKREGRPLEFYCPRL